MKSFIGILTLFILGTGIGSFITYTKYNELNGFFEPSKATQAMDSAPKEKEPLYWVAPMDPNYQRDKPGQSPMGMDLIPFYGDEGGGTDVGPGAVKISPDVVNNLGVKTALVTLDSLRPEIQTVGYVKYDEDHLVHIHPRVKGWIEKLYIKASGDPVKKGQPLYDIYSPELVNAQEELMLALDRKATRLIKAAENRLIALRVPRSIVNQLKKSREVRQTITFFAPQNGVVDNLNIRQGFFVTPGSTIMSIGNLEQVWVEAEVFERQASGVAVGLPVTMTLDHLPGEEWIGKVDYVYPTLNAKTRTLRVRLRFDNDKRLLKPNMFAQVVIHQDKSQKRLLIPKEAVIRSGLSNRVVLAVGEGRFKSVYVKVGRYDERSAEILSGLSEGEEVVTSAQFLIDSESSKTSDFKRMNHGEKVLPASVWVEATINSLMVDHRMINASHKAIDVWDWPEMTMDFTVAPEVDFSALEKGMKLNVEISKIQENKYQITKVHIPGSEDENKSLDDLSLDDMSLDDMSPDEENHDGHKQ